MCARLPVCVGTGPPGRSPAWTCASSQAPSLALASSGTQGGGPCGLKIGKPCDPQPHGTAPGPAGPQADTYCGEDVSQRGDGRPPCHRPEQGLNQVPARQALLEDTEVCSASPRPSRRRPGREQFLSCPSCAPSARWKRNRSGVPGRKPRLSGLRPALICRQRFPGVVGAAAGNPGRGPVPRAGHQPAGSVGEGGGAGGAEPRSGKWVGRWNRGPECPKGRPARGPGPTRQAG